MEPDDLISNDPEFERNMCSIGNYVFKSERISNEVRLSYIKVTTLATNRAYNEHLSTEHQFLGPDLQQSAQTCEIGDNVEYTNFFSIPHGVQCKCSPLLQFRHDICTFPYEFHTRPYYSVRLIQVLESLNLVLVVGLSVDYVVHLAEGYCRSTKPDRRGRLADMLEEVGISVLSGAVTTLGSSIFLFLAVITFFKQFGSFMFATIGFSLLYSLLLFVATLSIIGPQGDFCSLTPLWRRIKSKLCK